MSDSGRFIVITSIFNPTEAVSRFARLPGWRLVVAGDRKTPPDWSCDGAEYLPPAAQEAAGFRIAGLLPWNHYCRKMLGYLHAARQGASVIVDTDDDNIPKPGWSFPPFEGEFATVSDDRGFVNVYSLYTRQRIWPRGLPLNRLIDPAANLAWADLARDGARVGVWQGLADGDPDVDAVYRLVDNTPCVFDDREPVVLGRGTLCPFNSQNTAFRRELFPLLYLPAFVTFRFTDILRGLVAQPIMWLHGWRLGFSGATVVQERNEHDYLKDFESEVPMYLRGSEAADLVASVIRPGDSVASNLLAAYEALARAGIVPDRELPVLKAWLSDLAAAGTQ